MLALESASANGNPADARRLTLLRFNSLKLTSRAHRPMRARNSSHMRARLHIRARVYTHEAALALYFAKAQKSPAINFNALTLHRMKVHTVYCIHYFYTVSLHRMKVLLLALESASANKMDFNMLNFYTLHFRTSPR